MAKAILILLQIILVANVLLAESCSRESTCNSCKSCKARKLAAVRCYIVNDLIILLDASASVESGNYDTAKSFAAKLAAAYIVQSGSRISFITFSHTATTVVTLRNELSPAAISSSILDASYSAGDTYTNLGIDAAIAQFNSSPRSVPRNLVVLTDGESTDPTLTAAAAATVASMEVRTFSVGIGNSINPTELLTIANG